MEARCAHCTDVAQYVITYEDALAVQTQEAACNSCKDARSARDNFNAKSLNAVEVEF